MTPIIHLEDIRKSYFMGKQAISVSDHGYRAAGESDIRYPYQTFNAVFLPGKDYRHWYDGVTSVNQYRVLLNSLFGERLSLLKDSIVYHNTVK